MTRNKDAEDPKCRCQDCGKRQLYSEGRAAEHLYERLGLGEPYMDHECRDCGALLAILTEDEILEDEIKAIPVPEGMTRFKVIQARDGVVHYEGYVDARDHDQALDLGTDDRLLGRGADNWIETGHDTYDNRAIGVEDLDGFVLIEPKEQ